MEYVFNDSVVNSFAVGSFPITTTGLPELDSAPLNNLPISILMGSISKKSSVEGFTRMEFTVFDSNFTLSFLAKKLNEIYLEYEKQCQKEGLVDFGELLLRCYELFETKIAIRQHYQDRFKHILIDEFQDTSELQYKWLKLLAGSSSFVFAVGDDDQSIYSFRGARVGNMKDLERDFHVKQIIKLEQNYRSTKNIVGAANAIIKLNKQQIPKEVWTENPVGDKILITKNKTDNDEGRYVAESIFENKMQQPSRTNQQKLKVFEE